MLEIWARGVKYAFDAGREGNFETSFSRDQAATAQHWDRGFNVGATARAS